MKRWLALLGALLSLGSAVSACGTAEASSTTLETAASVPTADPTAGLSESIAWEQAAQADRIERWGAAIERNRKVALQKARADRSRRYAPSVPTNTPKPTEATTDPSPDFWRRLANCESADGRSGKYLGYFQFSRDTASKVGINGSESYEVQREAAVRWLGMIGGRGGSRSGWPRCWWIALRG
jgi:hypothetical protein